jgi:hypothetical protein
MRYSALSLAWNALTGHKRWYNVMVSQRGVH